MKKLPLLFLFLFITACGAPQVADNANAAVALLDLKAQYLEAKAGLHRDAAQLPAADRERLRNLERSADLYVHELEYLWRTDPALSIASLEHIYHRGERLYHLGARLIDPQRENLSPETLLALERFADSAQAVRTAYDGIQAGASDRRELIRAGLGLATLAIKVAATL